MYVDDRTRLRHAIDAIQEIASYTAGKSRQSLDGDRTLELVLTRLVEIVGEAVKNVSRNCQTAHPEVPWRSLADARNDLIHHYYSVDLDGLWEAAAKELPACLPDLRQVLSEIEATGAGSAASKGSDQ